METTRIYALKSKNKVKTVSGDDESRVNNTKHKHLFSCRATTNEKGLVRWQYLYQLKYFTTFIQTHSIILVNSATYQTLIFAFIFRQ